MGYADPISSIQADDAWTDGVETDGQFQERTSKEGIMPVGRREQEMHRQAGAARQSRV
jgi:hypothetical protein